MKPKFRIELTPSPQFGRRQLWLVPITSIEAWEFNPRMRTEEHALGDLEDRFDKDIGQLVPGAAVCISKDGVVSFRLIDAHRRLELCKRAGIEAMELVVYPDVEADTQKFGQLFDTLNGGSRKVNARERTGLVLDGQDGAGGALGIKHATLAERLLDGVGMEVFRDNDQPNHTLEICHQLGKEIQGVGLISRDGSALRRFVSDAFVWAIQRKQPRKVIEYRKFYKHLIANDKVSTGERARKRLVEWIQKDLSIPPVTEWTKTRRSGIDDELGN